MFRSLLSLRTCLYTFMPVVPSNPTLLNNDVIVVGRSGRTTFTDNVGGVLAPFSPINRILGIFFDIFD